MKEGQSAAARRSECRQRCGAPDSSSATQLDNADTATTTTPSTRSHLPQPKAPGTRTRTLRNRKAAPVASHPRTMSQSFMAPLPLLRCQQTRRTTSRRFPRFLPLRTTTQHLANSRDRHRVIKKPHVTSCRRAAKRGRAHSYASEHSGGMSCSSGPTERSRDSQSGIES